MMARNKIALTLVLCFFLAQHVTGQDVTITTTNSTNATVLTNTTDEAASDVTSNVTVAPTPRPTPSPTKAPITLVAFNSTGTETVAPSPPTLPPVYAAPILAPPTEPTPPTPAPTNAPTKNPTPNPTAAPTKTPSEAPTVYPTIQSLGEYFERPKLKWSIKLDGTGLLDSDAKLSKGNAVLVSPDGLSVYVTTDNGGLQVLSAGNGGNRFMYQPPPLAEGFTVKCNSGVYFGQKGNGEQYAVYAIIDVPPDTTVEDYSSYVYHHIRSLL